jgi:hypothetical protein
MTRYLVTYHGGEGMPATEEGRQQVMAAFMAWAQGVGEAMVDPGAPLGASRSVTSAGDSAEPAPGPAGGYTVLEAASLDDAVALVRDHPFVGRGGALQVSESVAP